MAKLAILARKVYEEITKYVVLESLKTLSIEEVQRKAVEEATMMDVYNELVLEGVIIGSIQIQFEQKQKWRSLREFNLQWNMVLYFCL